MLTWEDAVEKLSKGTTFYQVRGAFYDNPSFHTFTVKKQYPFFFFGEDEENYSFVEVETEYGDSLELKEYEFGEDMFLNLEEAKKHFVNVAYKAIKTKEREIEILRERILKV